MKKIQIGEYLYMIQSLVSISPIQYTKQFVLTFSNGKEVTIAYNASQQRADLISFLDNNSEKLILRTI